MAASEELRGSDGLTKNPSLRKVLEKESRGNPRALGEGTRTNRRNSQVKCDVKVYEKFYAHAFVYYRGF